MPVRSSVRFLFTMLTAAAVLALTAGAAAATCGGYPPTASSLTANPAVVDPGGTITVCGDGFAANATSSIAVTVRGSAATTLTGTSDGDGAFCTDFTAPNDPGATVGFAADDGECQAAAEVQIRVPTQVAGEQTTNSPNLAFTGRTLGPLAAFGAILVAAGAMFWLIGQRRSAEAS